MPEAERSWISWWQGILQNAAWDSIKNSWQWASPFVIPLGYGVIQKARHLSLDLWVLGALIALSLISPLIGWLATGKKAHSSKTQLPEVQTSVVPDSCAGLLSRPQVEAIKLVRGLRKLIADAGAEPDFAPEQENRDLEYLANRLTDYNRRLFEWSSRFNANYNLHFAEAIENYRLAICVMKVEKTAQIRADLWSLEAIPGRGVKTSDDAEEIIEALQRLFIYLDVSTAKPESEM
jgi:hypothetical protein